MSLAKMASGGYERDPKIWRGAIPPPPHHHLSSPFLVPLNLYAHLTRDIHQMTTLLGIGSTQVWGFSPSLDLVAMRTLSSCIFYDSGIECNK